MMALPPINPSLPPMYVCLPPAAASAVLPPLDPRPANDRQRHQQPAQGPHPAHRLPASLRALGGSRRKTSGWG